MSFLAHSWSAVTQRKQANTAAVKSQFLPYPCSNDATKATQSRILKWQWYDTTMAMTTNSYLCCQKKNKQKNMHRCVPSLPC